MIGQKTIYDSVLPDFPDVLTVEQVSEAIGVCTKTVYKLIHTGELDSIRVGRQIRVPKLSILAYMKIFFSFADGH